MFPVFFGCSSSLEIIVPFDSEDIAQEPSWEERESRRPKHKER